MSDTHVKISFPLEQDEDGYPTESVETLWALELEKGLYKLDNIPFYAQLISDGDIVSAAQSPTGELVFKKIIKPSKNCTIRVVMLDNSDGLYEREKLKGMGCQAEGSGTEGFFSVSVDKKKYDAVSSYLLSAHEMGKLDYEESAIR